VDGAEHVLRVKATPLRMIEAWALGDAAAVQAVAGKDGDPAAIPRHPEETWGDERDRASGHPKCVLRCALGREPTPEDFAEVARVADIHVLRASCPASFAPFADEAERAGNEARVAGVLEP
jgi:hypothetical protein